MKPRTLAILSVCTVAAIGLAGYSLSTQRTRTAAPEAGGPVLPALADRTSDVARVSIVRGASSFTVERTAAGGWAIIEKGGYPAKFEQVKEVIVGLSALAIIEPRTQDPDNYSKIGVEDPGSGGSDSTLVTFADPAGVTIASIILGRPKTAVGFNAPADLYVRRAGEAQSWLARPGRGMGRIEVRTEPLDWVERIFLSIPRDRIQSATIRHTPDGEEVVVTRETADAPAFTYTGLPEGRELTYPGAADAVGGALSSVSLDDVKPASDVSFESVPPAEPIDVATAEFRTFDGLVVTVRSAMIDDRRWAKFEVAYNPPGEPADAIGLEADALNARLAPFAFAVPDFQARNFATRAKDLLKPLPGEPEPPIKMPEGIQPFEFRPPDGPVGPAIDPPPR